MSNDTKSKEPVDTAKDIEYVVMEQVTVPDYTYGQSQEQLDFNVALRNKPQSYSPLLFIGV